MATDGSEVETKAMQAKSNPKILLKFAEACLCDAIADSLYDAIFSIAPNPFELGKKHQKEMWRQNHTGFAKRLIWC